MVRYAIPAFKAPCTRLSQSRALTCPTPIPFIRPHASPQQTTLSALLLLRTPRLLRLTRLMSVFDRMRGANIVRMIKLLFFIIIVAHWINCFWFLLYRLLRDSVQESWSMETQLGDNSELATYFLNGCVSESCSVQQT